MCEFNLKYISFRQWRVLAILKRGQKNGKGEIIVLEVLKKILTLYNPLKFISTYNTYKTDGNSIFVKMVKLLFRKTRNIV